MTLFTHQHRTTDHQQPVLTTYVETSGAQNFRKTFTILRARSKTHCFWCLVFRTGLSLKKCFIERISAQVPRLSSSLAMTQKPFNIAHTFFQKVLIILVLVEKPRLFGFTFLRGCTMRFNKYFAQRISAQVPMLSSLRVAR